MLKIILLFFVTALAEISACYCAYLWLRKEVSSWILIPCVLSLLLFVWLLSLHPEASGRVYATYGGIYIISSLIWLRLVDNIKLSYFDLAGAGFILVGVFIILAGWRTG